jgi:cobalt-zinc-cadmium efflux system outer membrane protein
LPFFSGSYLHERNHKRELRRESAEKSTAIVIFQETDQERTLLFSLRTSFIQALQQKATLAVTQENLKYYDHLLEISQDRFKAADIAQVDLDRLELQRIQFESDVQTATVNLRTAKIQMLALLNDHAAVEHFDVIGPFDFTDQILVLPELREMALQTRPDLQAAIRSIDKARTDYRLAVANGGTDPTFSWDFARNPPIPVYFGVSVNLPLRIFDRNQGERARTQLDIRRNESMAQATKAQVLSDVDSA